MIKTWFYQEILEEGTVELKTGMPEAIRRLDDMEMTSCTTDTGELSLCCVCTRKGRIHVGRYTSRSMMDDWVNTDVLSYYLQGQLYNEEGRTKVYYRVVHDKSNRLWTIVGVSVFALATAVLVALAAYSLLAGARISSQQDVEFMLTAGLAVVTLLGLVATRFGRKRQKGTAPPELKAFLLARLEAVERWED